jgi:hypothetical protein
VRLVRLNSDACCAETQGLLLLLLLLLPLLL